MSSSGSVTSTNRAARALRERLLSLSTDGLTVDLAVEGFRDFFGAAAWATHRMARTSTGYAPDFLEQSGWPERRHGAYLSYLGEAQSTPFLYDPERPAANQRNRVVVFHAKEYERLSAGTLKVLTTAGLAGQHQLRVVVCDGPELLGWFGGFRERPFTTRDADAMRALVPAVRTALLWKRRLLRADEAAARFDAALDALTCPAFVVRNGHTLEHVNAAGRPLVEAHGRAIVGMLAARAAEGLAECVALTGRGLSRLELFVLRGPNDTLEAAVARATGAWKLTRRQREVLSLLASGDTNKSIATKLRCAEVTVELHMTALLRRGNATNRTELVTRLLSLR